MKKKVAKVTPRPKLKPPKKKKRVKQAPLAPAAVEPEVTQDVPKVGRQPIEFYKERYGMNFRIIDNIGFVFSGGRWVSVDVDGFPYMEREIGPGDPQFTAT